MIVSTKEIRQASNNDRQSCFVCGKHAEITEAHHLVPLQFLKVFMNMQVCVTGFYNELIHLCPNHHTYMHVFENNPVKFVSLDLSTREKVKFNELIGIRKTLLLQLCEVIKSERYCTSVSKPTCKHRRFS